MPDLTAYNSTNADITVPNRATADTDTAVPHRSTANAHRRDHPSILDYLFADNRINWITPPAVQRSADTQFPDLPDTETQTLHLRLVANAPPNTLVTPYKNGTDSVGQGKYIFRDYKIVAHISDTTKEYHDASVMEWPMANHVAWDKLTQGRYHDSESVIAPSEAKGTDMEPRTVIEI